MSFEVRATEIHQDAQLTPAQLLKRSQVLAAASDEILPVTVIRLGDASRHLDVFVPSLQRIARDRSQALTTAARVISNVSAFARTLAAALKGGKTLLEAVNNPAALLGLVSGLTPGTDAKALQLALALGHDVLDFTLNPGEKAGLGILRDLSGAAGQLGKQNPYASVTDVLLSGVSTIIGGQDLQIDRFLSGSLIALSKDLSAQAGALRSDAGGDL